MATDPICGMEVDESSSLTSTRAGQRFYFCSPQCKQKFDAQTAAKASTGDKPDLLHRIQHAALPAGHAAALAASPMAGAMPRTSKEVAKDPICGMVVDKATALKSERAGRTYYFCSIGCQRTFESPETELKSMRTRVAIALTGVLALAILRAGAFLALAAGATIVT